MSQVTLTVGLANYGAPPGPEGWRGLVDVARRADDAGIDRVVVVDHVVMGQNTDAYQWGRFPVPPESPWLEPLTVLAAIAGATERVRLSTGILIAPLRPPAFLAKQVATLDQLSGGRVDLGVGTGWQREEYEAMGLDFERRGPLLTASMRACRTLWEGGPVALESPDGRVVEPLWCEPRPAQERLPIWCSGTLTGRNVRRIVELGDGWIPIMGATLDDVRDGAARLRDEFAAAGRTEAPLVQMPLAPVRDADGVPQLGPSLEAVPGMLAAGVTDVIASLGVWCRDAARIPGFLADLRTAFDATR